MANPETKMVWKEVLDRFLVLLLSMTFLVVVAAGAAIFVVDSPLDLKIRAWIFVKLDQPDMALKAYVKLTQVDPGNYKAIETVGDLYTRQGAHREAAAYYSRVAQRNRSVPDLLKAAISAEKAGLKEESFKHYQEVLSLDPNNVVAKTNIASVKPPAPAKTLVSVSEHLGRSEKAQEAKPEGLDTPVTTPKVVDQETGAQKSEITGAEPSQKPTEPKAPKSLLPCNQMLREVKDLIGETEPDKLSLFRERIGDPHRSCETERAKTYCFKCIVRGRLTDTMEIVEKDDRIDNYYFGSCNCAENTVK